MRELRDFIENRKSFLAELSPTREEHSNFEEN
jgi:hypothetical protein